MSAHINIILDGMSRVLLSVRNFRLFTKLQSMKFLKTLSISDKIGQAQN